MNNLYFAYNNWKPTDNNSFVHDGSYGQQWSAFIYDESIKNSYTNVYPNAKVYSLTVRPKIDKEFQRLIDFNYGRRLKQQVHYYHQLI